MTNETAKLLQMRAELQRIQRKIEMLENDSEVQKDIELRNEIEQILNKAGKTPDFLLVIFSDYMEHLAPVVNSKLKAVARKVHTRPLITYKNPNTGDVIQTRGANHGMLKAWKKKYGSEVVNEWVESVDNSA